MIKSDPSPTSPKQRATKALVSSPSRGEEGDGPQRQPGYSKRTLRLAKQLRREMTSQDMLLWKHLRDRWLGGFNFRDQQPIGPFVSDFACLKEKLIVEGDGSQHADIDYDKRRDEFLTSKGYRVIRFWNNEITSNLNGALETILAALTISSPHEEEDTKALAASYLGDVGEGLLPSNNKTQGASHG